MAPRDTTPAAQPDPASTIQPERAANPTPPPHSPPPIFHLFPLLPTELRLMIWAAALSNTFVLYERLKAGSDPNNPGHPLYVYHRRLDKRRWMRLMLACKTSYEVARKADAEGRRNGVRGKEKGYWIFGRKWEEICGAKREVGEWVEEDANLRW